MGRGKQIQSWACSAQDAPGDIQVEVSLQNLQKEVVRTGSDSGVSNGSGGSSPEKAEIGHGELSKKGGGPSKRQTRGSQPYNQGPQQGEPIKDIKTSEMNVIQ